MMMMEFAVVSELMYFALANPTYCGHVAKWIGLDTEVSGPYILSIRKPQQ